ncbi:MAG TPA: hypothetical protein VNA20_13225, partial [Frankiaceae bacterium]|nr:hypothetical protein [Frankiaceae bacterium]
PPERTADRPAPTARAEERWRETVETAPDDRPGEDCETPGLTDAWCFRFLGPVAVRSGSAVTFSAELCRLPGGRAADRVDLATDVELDVLLIGDDANGDTYVDDGAHAWDGGGRRPHSRAVPVGTCVRWHQRFNGVGQNDRPLAPGRYDLRVLVQGTTPRAPLPGEADRATERAHGYFGEIEVT